MRKWYPAALIAAAVAFSVAVYSRLPDRMAVHWNVHGEPDRWGGRLEGAFVLPAAALVIWLLMLGLPKIDPRKENYEKFRPTYDLVIAAVVTGMTALHVVVVGAALGWPVSIARVVPIVIGGLFIVLGNVLPRARSNWWFGIRTPWTLSNERVWERTHRVGGYLMIATGMALIAAAFLPARFVGPVILAAAAVMALGTLVYSYFAWRQETSR